uniref:ADAM_CR_2 domain-containing protein n=1 Tax=Heterorhabditis bacteriophora TaxID=37862 RepID=A0A1I7X9D5_HETBA
MCKKIFRKPVSVAEECVHGSDADDCIRQPAWFGPAHPANFCKTDRCLLPHAENTVRLMLTGCKQNRGIAICRGNKD